MASWTTPADVTGAWIGEGAPTDDTLVQTWIDRAERLLRRRVPDLQARIDDEAAEEPPRTDLVTNTVDVVVAMVTRVFRNPEGIRQQQVTTGPFTGSRTYGGDTPGGLEPTEDEIADLVGARSSGAFTISLIPTSSPFHPDHVPAYPWL